MNKFFSLAAGLLITLAGNAQTIDVTYNCGTGDQTGTIEITGTQGNSTVFYDWTDSYSTYACSTDLNDSCIVFSPDWMYCPDGTGAYLNVNSTCVLYADPALALFNSLFDPTSCTNGSAVSECYELGYQTALEECESDTVVVTDTVIVDISQETIDYYLNIIANFENATTELQNTIAQLNDSINGLEGTIATQAQVINITQFALDNCFDDNADLDATIDNQQTYIDQLLLELDSQQAVITTLTTSLDECTGDLTACEETNADIVDAYNELGDLYNECAADLGDATADLTACDATAEVWQNAAEFYADSLASTLAILDAIKLELSDCTDAVEYNFALIQDLIEENESLEALVDALIYQLEVNADEAANLINLYLATIDDLENALAECEGDLTVAEDETLYWMDTYGDYVNACDSATSALQDEVDALNDALESKSCDEEYEAGYTQGLLDAPYNYGDVMQAYEFGLSNCECEYNYGDVMEAFYNGYQEGLGDCDGTTGIDILDPSGNVLTQVTGYFNELGQVIDPRTYDGVVIRRHADGTFSKYYVQR